MKNGLPCIFTNINSNIKSSNHIINRLNLAFSFFQKSIASIDFWFSKIKIRCDVSFRNNKRVKISDWKTISDYIG